MTQKNITVKVLEAIKNTPNRIAFENKSSSLTYEEFGRLIGAFVLRMSDDKVGQSSLVGIKSQDPRFVTAGILATQWLGAAWVDITKGNINNQEFRVTHTLTLTSDDFEIGDENVIRIDSQTTNDPRISFWEVYCPFQGFKSSKAIAWIDQSSGTTGRAKFLLFTAESIYKLLLSEAVYLTNETNRIMNALPPLSPGGSRIIIKSLLRGKSYMTVGIEDIKDFNVDTIIGSPFHMDMCGREINKRGINGVENAIVVGGSVSEKLLNRIRNFSKNVYISYGSTEIGIVGGRLIGPNDDYRGALSIVNEREAVFEIVGNDRKVLPFGEVGLVRIKTDTLPISIDQKKKYVGEWFYPGDLGIIFKNREFKVVGRSSDSVNIGGVTINLIDLDKIVQSCKFVSDGFSFVIENNEGIGELHLIACYFEGEDIEVSSNKLLEIISKYTTLATRPKSVFVSGTIPRTSTGKPMRHKVLSILQN